MGYATRIAAALVASSALLAAGCSATCDEACNHVASVCADTYRAAGTTFDVDECVSECSDSMDDCEDSDGVACLTGIQTCAEAAQCTHCGDTAPRSLAVPSCAAACVNVAKVCQPDREQIGATFDPAACVESCVEQSDCTNVLEMAACNAAAVTCGSASQCPRCER